MPCSGDCSGDHKVNYTTQNPVNTGNTGSGSDSGSGSGSDSGTDSGSGSGTDSGSGSGTDSGSGSGTDSGSGSGTDSGSGSTTDSGSGSGSGAGSNTDSSSYTYEGEANIFIKTPGACGVPPEFLETTDIVALSASGENSMFDKGSSCGRWVEVKIN
jgi:hypothetical protein